MQTEVILNGQKSISNLVRFMWFEMSPMPIALPCNSLRRGRRDVSGPEWPQLVREKRAICLKHNKEQLIKGQCEAGDNPQVPPTPPLN
ncbi:hypothetical protein CEXT_394861 [Caerostris extrusa]|uniref:Uncharacterized protein n=1 Tax=Caerostris extrusa TaxID=172846 RepID=A0AAV4XAH2_CAEEX|nr:hypothetical protein CEXT_394861 [Caerostris extrusa]